MRVLVVEPRKKPYVKEIENGLESLQSEVGGYIEIIYPFEDSVGLVCNESGKLEDLEKNRALRAEGSIYDIIYGTFLVVGLGDEDLCSLNDEMLEKYKNYYKCPESFIYVDGKILVVRVPWES